MESETKLVNQNKNMDVLDILKETLTIYFKNINFIIFTFLTSLPYFFLMIYFETLFQQTLLLSPQIISSLALFEKIYMFGNDTLSYIGEPSFVNDYLPLLIQLGFIYTVPLHVLEFFSAVVTIGLASKLSSEENHNDTSLMSIKHMFQNSNDISIMKRTFTTSLYMLALSFGLLIACPWTVIGTCYGLYSAFGCYIFFATISCVAIGKLLMVYLEWSAIWNMSIVTSVLDGIYGIRALRVSYFYSSGNQKRGLVLMLVFFVYGVFLRLICIYFGCYKGGSGIFLLIGIVGILTVVNILKWVSCVIYFNDCKERKMEMKVDDEEIGKVQLESNSSKT